MAAQVTTDPATLAPTNKLDPRAIAWLQSLGVIQKETLEVFQNSYQSKLMGIKLSFSRQKRDFRLRYTVHAVRQFCMLSIFDFGCGDFSVSYINDALNVIFFLKKTIFFFALLLKISVLPFRPLNMSIQGKTESVSFTTCF